jgi:DNA-binding transcriptional MerR regulator
MGEPKDTAEASEVIADGESLFAVADVARLFGIPEGRLRYWSQTGFVVPSERRQSRRFYSFRDLIAIKVAKELLDDGQPLQRVRRSLDALRFKLPRVDSPLARLRIRSEDGRIVVDDGENTFEAATGQMMLDFDVEALRDQAAEVVRLPWVGSGGGEPDAAEAFGPAGDSAYDLFLHAQELEARWDGASTEDPRFSEARAAYERLVELDPGFAAAWTNLGSLAAHAEDLVAARDHFDQALRCDPEQPEAQCNLAEMALREGDVEVAIAGFRQVLLQDPDHGEAHYGLARGLLAVGGRGQALAHLERFCTCVDQSQLDRDDPRLRERRHKAQSVVDALRRELGH